MKTPKNIFIALGIVVGLGLAGGAFVWHQVAQQRMNEDVAYIGTWPQGTAKNCTVTDYGTPEDVKNTVLGILNCAPDDLTEMSAPDGTLWVIPKNNVARVLAEGGTLGRPSIAKPQTIQGLTTGATVKPIPKDFAPYTAGVTAHAFNVRGFQRNKLQAGSYTCVREADRSNSPYGLHCTRKPP